MNIKYAIFAYLYTHIENCYMTDMFSINIILRVSTRSRLDAYGNICCVQI